MKRIARLLVILFAFTFVPLHTVSESGTAERLTATVVMPDGRSAEAFLLTDGFADTHAFFQKDSTVRFTFSEEAASLVTVWHSNPGSVTLTCYSGDTKLSEAPLDVPFLSTVTELPVGTTAVELTLAASSKEPVSLSDVYAYTAGVLPETEYQWRQAEQVDVLLVAGFPGDEYRFFGGLLPKLINDGVNVAVLYCADYSRARLEEGFSALWALGLRTYPVRIGVDSELADPKTRTYRSLDGKELQRAWKKSDIERALADRIRALAPAVVIAPTDGKDGVAEAYAVSDILQEVLKSIPDSFRKFYLAESGEGAVTIADEALPYYGGQSANAIAQSLLDSFHSVDFFEYRIRTEGTYRLVKSHVGADTKGDTLLEHVKITLNPPAPPTPEPTPEPTAAPTEEPTAAPTDTPAPTATIPAIAIEDEEIAAETAEPTAAPTTAPQKRGFLSCAQIKSESAG